MSLEDLVDLPDDMKTKFVAQLASRVLADLDEETRAAFLEELLGKVGGIHGELETLTGQLQNWTTIMLRWAKDDDYKKNANGFLKALRDFDLEVQLDQEFGGEDDDDDDQGGGDGEDEQPPPDQPDESGVAEPVGVKTESA